MLGFRNMAPPKKDLAASVAPTGSEPSELQRECEQLVFTLLRRAREEANEEDLSLPQLLILGALRQSGRVSVTQLTTWTGGSVSAISGLLDGLVDAKLLLREHGVEDRRQVLVSLSADGRRLTDRVSSRRAVRWAPIDASIRVSDSKVVVKVIHEVVASLTMPGSPDDTLPPDAPATGRASGASNEARKVAA
jgi:DNA-binding MarR family transcriptional regulator